MRIPRSKVENELSCAHAVLLLLVYSKMLVDFVFRGLRREVWRILRWESGYVLDRVE